ncbi:MAG: CRISPR-associated endonuclease Cas2 [Longicatena sp.]
MYLIVIYDVESKQDPKVMKILKQYLFHVQNSVFEGELSPAKTKALKSELNKLHYKKKESIIFYSVLSVKQLHKEGLTNHEIDFPIII